MSPEVIIGQISKIEEEILVSLEVISGSIYD
jgi:hypothetical protein